MSTWVMVILITHINLGYADATAVTSISGFATKDGCVSQIPFVKKRSDVSDAYCLELK